MNLLHIIKRIAIATVLTVVAGSLSYAQDAAVVTEGEVFTLGVIPVPGDSYEWAVYTDHTLETEALPPDVVFMTGNTGPVVPVLWSATGTYYYTVTAFNPTGCMNLKVGMITVDELKTAPAISIIVNRNPMCPGDPVTFIASPYNPGSNPYYQWYRNGYQVGDNLRYYPDTSLVHNDVVYCELTNTTLKQGPMTVTSNKITMAVQTVIAAFTITENVDNKTGRVRFNNKSVGADLYHWDFGNGYYSHEENPVVNYTEDGNYFIRLVSTSPLNCTDTSRYPYELIFKGLFIPNAFAPTVTNGPGGKFRPAGVNLKRYKIEVYDTWGDLIWESNKIDSKGRPVESWDGTFNGKLMPQGTYLWKVNAEFIDGTIWQGADIGKGKGKAIGTVTLLR